MKTLHLSIIVYLVIFSVISPAWAAVDFNSYLPIAGTPITPQFQFSKTVTIDYPEGGKIKNVFNGRTIHISFSDNSDKNPDIRYLMDQINTNLETDRKSTAKITNLNMNYQVSIIGNDKQVIFDYQTVLTPTITDYVLNKGGGNVPTVLDVSWMGFAVKTPVTIATKQYGNLEINSPMGVIQSQFPDVYYILEGTAAESALNLNLMDASSLVAYPIDRWNTLFDPAYLPPETAGYEYTGQKVAATAFAYGQSDIYQGSEKHKTVDTDFTADSKYHLTIVERASSGTMDVEGHASGYLMQGYPAISTLIMRTGYISSPMSGEHPIGGLSTVEIYTIAGIAAAITVSLFLWSYRKWLK
jgi:hypothetical protein